MKNELLNDVEDIEWLKSTHLKHLSYNFNSFMIYGNEDCPNKVELFEEKDPTIYSKPIVTLSMNQDLVLDFLS